ncbi:hypothetical protein VTK73DRAFT_8789 [Phialemonium thermophilum]|uniref:CID domain-containing protein n=1 Tax=Phialemonium thermophilum TaxID=223376 RepID=A0ABR3XMW8_9PEZI
MSSSKKIAEFPDVEAKLQKPTKQSAFDKKKAEAEAKRQREAAETAAVYEDFIKSFQHDDDNNGSSSGRSAESSFPNDTPGRPAGFRAPAPFGGGAGSGRRHFGIPSTSSMKSGPGSLGPPPSSFGRKRYFDGTPAGAMKDRDDGGPTRFSLEGQESGSNKLVSKAFSTSDDEDDTGAVDRAEEKAISRPTLRLANLPPTISAAAIKAMMPTNLTVENVKLVPPSGPTTSTERKSYTAIVTLSKETPATDMDAAVSALQNRYLGFGFYLSLHRHLSSAAISAMDLTSPASSAIVSHPFGAKRVAQPAGFRGAQPLGRGRGFAPPSSYGPPGGGPVGRSGVLHVPVRPPKDIRKLRMIHKVIEAVLEHGPEFEALLMSRPDVQREERWAWIWDARSEGGIWYRWRLWEIVTGMRAKSGQPQYLPLFEGGHAWKRPDQPLAYEYTTGVDEFVSDSEYNSSDEDDLEDEPARQAEGATGSGEQEDAFLNPIEKSRIAHLLARLPTSLSKLRKGDIARVTTFAITHASRGSDEITEMIVSNVERPFAYTSANPDYKRRGGKDKITHDGDDRARESPESTAAHDDKAGQEVQDTSAARLVGLYVVNDILSSSSTSGIRHAWRYRQLFESALRRHKTFESLGMMAEKYNWGRLRAEKWKRSIGLILSLWEGWCVFPAETQEFFVNSFENPPLLKRDEKEDDGQRKTGRWKAVQAPSAAVEKGAADVPSLPVSRKPPSRSASPMAPSRDTERMLDAPETGETDGELNCSYDGRSGEGAAALLSDEDIDGEPIGEVEGPISRDVEMEEVHPDVSAVPAPAGDDSKREGVPAAGTTAARPRERPRAVDMFADSGSESGE